jgi:hypothetical protein
MKIQVNRHPAGGLSNLALCQLADGLIRTLSLGLLFSDLALNQTRRAAKRRRPK